MQTTRVELYARLLTTATKVMAPLVVACLAVGAGANLSAQTYYWDPNGTVAGIGGAGTWNMPSSFASSAAGTDSVTWNSIAASIPSLVFGGTAGAVTVDLQHSYAVHSMTFGSGYTLTGSGASLTFAGGTLAAPNYINISSGVTTTFNVGLSASQLDLRGGGVMNLAGRVDASVGGFTLTSGSVTNGTLTGTSYTLHNGTVSAVLADTVGAPANLTSDGAVTLGTANTYRGSTLITGGTLSLMVSGALPTTTDVSITGGGLLAVGAGTTQTVHGLNLNSGQLEVAGSLSSATGVVLSGSSSITGTGYLSSVLTIGSGARISPATSTTVGLLHTGSQIWAAGGTYDWNIANATGGAGLGWDLINFGGGSLTNQSGFTLNVIGLSTAANLTSGTTYSWLIANGLTRVDGLQNSLTILNDGVLAPNSTYSLHTQMDGGLYLDYTTPVPEPKDYAMILGAITFGLVGYRRWRRTQQPAGA